MVSYQENVKEPGTRTSVFILYMLFSVYLLRCWQGEFVNSIQFNQFYLNSHEYSVLEKVIIITVRSVTNINIKNTVQSQKKKQNNRNNLQFIVTKDI